MFVDGLFDLRQHIFPWKLFVVSKRSVDFFNFALDPWNEVFINVFILSELVGVLQVLYAQVFFFDLLLYVCSVFLKFVDFIFKLLLEVLKFVLRFFKFLLVFLSHLNQKQVLSLEIPKSLQKVFLVVPIHLLLFLLFKVLILRNWKGPFWRSKWRLRYFLLLIFLLVFQSLLRRQAIQKYFEALIFCAKAWIFYSLIVNLVLLFSELFDSEPTKQPLFIHLVGLFDLVMRLLLDCVSKLVEAIDVLVDHLLGPLEPLLPQLRVLFQLSYFFSFEIQHHLY